MCNVAPFGAQAPSNEAYQGRVCTAVRQRQYDGVFSTINRLAMIDPKILDDFARGLAARMPGMTALREDIEKNIRAGLEALFQRLDLVTREEYEVQAMLLARTRERLDDLVEQIRVLEAKCLEASLHPKPSEPESPIILLNEPEQPSVAPAPDLSRPSD